MAACYRELKDKVRIISANLMILKSMKLPFSGILSCLFNLLFNYKMDIVCFPTKYDIFENYYHSFLNSLQLGGIVGYQLWHYKIQSISLSLKIADVNLAHSRLLNSL